jgi:hypothetical protein
VKLRYQLHTAAPLPLATDVIMIDGPKRWFQCDGNENIFIFPSLRLKFTAHIKKNVQYNITLLCCLVSFN